MAKQRETFADRLTAIRVAAGFSQYRLAQLSGLSKQSVSVLEQGTSKPSWETVQSLAKALGVTCEAFAIEGAPLPNPPEPKKRGPKPKEK